MTAGLTSKQEVLYQNATQADLHYRKVKLEARAEAERIVAQSIAQAMAERDAAVRRAFDAGVRKTFFRRSSGGLHTSTPGAIDEILARTAHLTQVADAVDEAVTEARGGVRYSIDAADHMVIEPPTDALAQIAAEQDLDEWEPTVTATGINGTGHLQYRDSVMVKDRDGYNSTQPAAIWANKHTAEAVAWWKEQGK